MANEDNINTNALMMPHDSGIHVDIRKKPEVYTPLNLRTHHQSNSFGTNGRVRKGTWAAETYKPPTTLPAIIASMPPMITYTIGTTQMTFQFRYWITQA